MDAAPRPCYNHRMKRALLIIALLAASVAHAAPEPSILNPSGMPVPRYVALKFDEINMRVGPGERYPIKYVYRRAKLPVKIVEEFAHWRKITDFEGTSGWVRKSALDGKRTAMIIGKAQNLYDDPKADARVVMKAAPKVIGTVVECEPDWCRLEIEGRKGWIRKVDMWGVDREEVVKE